MESILQRAQRQKHAEICGLLGGTWTDRQAIVTREVAVPNIARDPRRAFAVNPSLEQNTYDEFEAADQRLVGIYHSHLFDECSCSAFDIDHMKLYQVVWLIVALRPEVHYAAWTWRKGHIAQVDVLVRGGEPGQCSPGCRS